MFILVQHTHVLNTVLGECKRKDKSYTSGKVKEVKEDQSYKGGKVRQVKGKIQSYKSWKVRQKKKRYGHTKVKKLGR